MSKVTMYVCDKCKKFIKGEKERHVLKLDDHLTYWDLCETCRDDFKKWIENTPVPAKEQPSAINRGNQKAEATEGEKEKPNPDEKKLATVKVKVDNYLFSSFMDDYLDVIFPDDMKERICGPYAYQVANYAKPRRTAYRKHFKDVTRLTCQQFLYKFPNKTAYSKFVGKKFSRTYEHVLDILKGKGYQLKPSQEKVLAKWKQEEKAS